MSQIECVVDAKQELGEGPVWCPRENALFWVDIRGPRIHRYDPASGATRAWTLPSVIGSFALREGSGMLLALQSGLHDYDRDTGTLALIADPEADQPRNRFNDGKCDRQGRFWVGTMSDDERVPTGALYRIDADRTYHRMRDGLTIPNSLAWSPDGRTMYFADTIVGQILAYDYDPELGRPGPPRTLVEAGRVPGHPDGSTVDEVGCLWNARYAGGRVVRFTPDGRVDRVVELPVSQVTCCAFGGPGLDTLFITSATQRMSPEARAAEPLAGGLFAVNVGVKGLVEPRFAG